MSSRAARAATAARVDAISVAGSGKGGVGKTTLPVKLAVALAKMRHRVAFLKASPHECRDPQLVSAASDRLSRAALVG